MDSFAQIRLKAYKRLLQMHFESGVGHIGGNLSSLDTLLVLYHQVLQKDDLFILSKGHSAGALYVALWSLGRLTEGDLKSFHGEKTLVSGHPAPKWSSDILFATGSLGHGFSLAAGVVLAKKLKKEPGRVFCLMSDGEWQEGSNWEALIFSVKKELGPLALVIDWNGLQGFGRTQDIGGLDPFAEKLRALGMPVEEMDGHDPIALEKALNRPYPALRTLIAHTHKGRGVSFMQDKMEWHYKPLTEPLYRQALEEIEKLQGGAS
ncbi:MAG TPA: 1-deoxy-D-xylulose-5-phosphate synthase N-terminal domain-containing protein [bacterium]|nr:1-deoxy-D-xylulose-5-phosphate synthase N-terminal domain-containing protein [bacterium]